MNRWLSGTVIIAALAAATAPARAFIPAVEHEIRGADAASQSREEALYESAREAIDEEQWQRAVERFDRLVAMKGTRADAGLFWKAYALNRLGQRAEALATLAALEKTYPDSRSMQQARALAMEIRSAGGQTVRPENVEDDELKLLAIQSLAHQDPEQAVPMLEKLIRGDSSARLKQRAMFVLAQMSDPRARRILADAAKDSAHPEVQSKAIQYLGVHGSAENRALLAEVYQASQDVQVKKRVLRAWMVAGEKDRILTAATGEKDPELRAEAVQQLGVMGAQDELSKLYQQEASHDVKKKVLQAMFVGGSADRLIELARTEKDPDLRRTAVRNLGLMGARRTGPALVEIYGADRDPAVRKAVIDGLFIQDNAQALVDLARRETDPALKRELVQKLSLMRSKVAIDYLLELLK